MFKFTKMARIVFTSIIGPVGIDCEDLTSSSSFEHTDIYIQNKQGEFSSRSQINHDPLDLMAYNIYASSVVLHWPTMSRLLSEIRKNKPEYVAMQVTTPTFERAENMTKKIKEFFPNIKVIYGGYAPEKGSADILIQGEGVSKMRELLGEKPREVKHPLIFLDYKVLYNSIGKSGVILNKVGCDEGCPFCSSYHYHESCAKYILTKEQLNWLVSRYVESGIHDLTIFDENFFRDRERIEFFHKHVRSLEELIDLTCFGCMKHIAQQPLDDLFDMGYHIWIGFEDFSSKYTKNDYGRINDFIKDLHAHGVKIIASTFIGDPKQSLADCKSTLDKVIKLGAYANQFNIETPFQNTKFYNSVEITDHRHKNYDGKHLVHKHPTISKEEMEKLQREGQEREYFELGPSLIRALAISFQGHTFKPSRVSRIQRRVEKIANTLRNALPLFDLAIIRHPNPEIKEKIKDLRGNIISEVGTPSWYLTKRTALRALGQVEATRLSLEKRFSRLKRQPRFIRRVYNQTAPLLKT